MSFITDIENAEHSTVAWLEKELLTIEKKAPAITTVVDTSVKYIGLTLQIGLEALGQTALATEVGAISTQAQADLATISATIADFGPTPTAATALAAVQTNLSAILANAGVKNSTTIATVTKAVSEVGVLGTAISTAAAAISASTAAATPAA